MKYKILKETKTFTELIKLKSKMKEVNDQAKQIVRSLGATNYCKDSSKLAGGIIAIQFDSKPDGYKSVGKSYQNLYYPKVSNKKDIELINNLPTIYYNELNNILKFKAPQTISTNGGIYWVSTVNLIWGDELILIEIPSECEYKPIDDMIEILDSEYIELKKKLLK